MASVRAFGLMRSIRATSYCRLPLTSSSSSPSSSSSSYYVNMAYRNNKSMRFASSVVAGDNININSTNSGGGGNISENLTDVAGATTTTDSPIKDSVVSLPSSDTNLQFKWEVATVVEEVAKHPKLTGAIIPFAQQTFLQKLFLPYTYAVMYYMDFLINYLPWWGAIIATTTTCKIIFFPLIVKQQRIGHQLHNLLPVSQKLQAQMNEAMCAGDSYNTNLNRAKLKLLYQQHNLSIKDRLWPALLQAPMFMSLFFLLRRLTEDPVDSLVTGGTLWFTNLTVPDPYFILPVVTCVSLFALLELGLGVEGASGGPSSNMRPVGRWVMRGMPVLLFAIIHNMPAGTLLFWTANNLFSLVTAIFMKQPSIMRKLNIPERIKHPPNSLPLTNQSLSSQIKAAKDMGQASKTTLDIRRLDDIAFKKAGVGPLKKTYKHPPKAAVSN